MTAEPTTEGRRSIWHPLVIAGALGTLTAVVAGATAATGVQAGDRAAWLTLGVWTCLGVACGFATSGST